MSALQSHMTFQHFEEKPYSTRRYFPVVAIIAAVATLILLLVIFTSRDISLARQRLEESLYQEGLTLIRAIEAGNRTGMRMRWAMNNLQILVEEIGKAPKIAYISIIGEEGSILAHTQPQLVGQKSDIDVAELRQHPLSRTIQSETGVDVFEILARTILSQIPQTGQYGQGMGYGRGMGTMQENSHPVTEIAAIQVGMKMTELQEMQRRDVRNTLVMVLVLAVVGSVALYFIVVIQNYHAVNHAFRTIKSYAQHVVDSMANGLISLDMNGQIVTMNRQAHHILELPSGESFQGHVLDDVLTIQQCDLFETLAAGQAVIEQERTCMTGSQKSLPLRLSASTLRDDDGNQLGIVLLFRDLSDVKALEEQVKRAERLASLGKLAAGVAHEIRNPLGALKGFLQYFQRKLDFTVQDSAYLQVMVSEVDRLNSVISQLLDFARPKEPVREATDSKELIRHVLTLIESDLHAKDIRFSVDMDDELPHIQVDGDQLTQVLLNIALNAISATDSGGNISIGVHIHEEMQQLELTITDTGHGIAPEDLPRIFDPFFSTKKQGSGLGLAIAYTIIEQHQGDISVQSEQDNGTAFRIRLPLS